MKYTRFEIEKYKGVKNSSIPVISDPIPIIGINESGKSSIMEAIAHFDFRNDTTADSRKWKFLNRYNPSEMEFKVSAFIEFQTEELEDISSKFSEEDKVALIAILPGNGVLKIDRIFRKNPPNTKLYQIADQESDLIQSFSKELIQKFPPIFYFDNFLDSPFPDRVEFPTEYLSNPGIQLNQDQAVIERVFAEAEYPLINVLSYSGTEDINDQGTCLGEVSTFITRKIMEDWEKMNLGVDELDTSSLRNLKIVFEINQNQPTTICIKIHETFKTDQLRPFTAYMDLSERSLGFRWFFNFSIKKNFGAKDGESIIYLFDEPGSFLHNSAQTILLKAIKDLAINHPVIYTTHSEFLLDPEVININNIRIVEKENREIKLVPYSQVSDEKNMGALSTLYNALRVKAPVNSTFKQKVIVTEGLTDFYFWRMLSDDFVFLPGFGAGQNEYLISLAIGTADKYIAIFDGDPAGDQAINKYKEHFNEEESSNWFQYKNSSDTPIKLEGFFSSSDKQRLKDMMNLPDMKKALTSLFYSDHKDEFWKGIDNDTKSNIQKTLDLIKEKLSLPSSFRTKYSLELGPVG